eukprot:g23170.t1
MFCTERLGSMPRIFWPGSAKSNAVSKSSKVADKENKGSDYGVSSFDFEAARDTTNQARKREELCLVEEPNTPTLPTVVSPHPPPYKRPKLLVTSKCDDLHQKRRSQPASPTCMPVPTKRRFDQASPLKSHPRKELLRAMSQWGQSIPDLDSTEKLRFQSRVSGTKTPVSTRPISCSSFVTDWQNKLDRERRVLSPMTQPSMASIITSRKWHSFNEMRKAGERWVCKPDGEVRSLGLVSARQAATNAFRVLRPLQAFEEVSASSKDPDVFEYGTETEFINLDPLELGLPLSGTDFRSVEKMCKVRHVSVQRKQACSLLKLESLRMSCDMIVEVGPSPWVDDLKTLEELETGHIELIEQPLFEIEFGILSWDFLVRQLELVPIAVSPPSVKLGAPRLALQPRHVASKITNCSPFVDFDTSEDEVVLTCLDCPIFSSDIVLQNPIEMHALLPFAYPWKAQPRLDLDMGSLLSDFHLKKITFYLFKREEYTDKRAPTLIVPPALEPAHEIEANRQFAIFGRTCSLLRVDSLRLRACSPSFALPFWTSREFQGQHISVASSPVSPLAPITANDISSNFLSEAHSLFGQSHYTMMMGADVLRRRGLVKLAPQFKESRTRPGEPIRFKVESDTEVKDVFFESESEDFQRSEVGNEMAVDSPRSAANSSSDAYEVEDADRAEASEIVESLSDRVANFLKAEERLQRRWSAFQLQRRKPVPPPSEPSQEQVPTYPDSAEPDPEVQGSIQHASPLEAYIALQQPQDSKIALKSTQREWEGSCQQKNVQVSDTMHEFLQLIAESASKLIESSPVPQTLSAELISNPSRIKAALNTATVELRQALVRNEDQLVYEAKLRYKLALGLECLATLKEHILLRGFGFSSVWLNELLKKAAHRTVWSFQQNQLSYSFLHDLDYMKDQLGRLADDARSTHANLLDHPKIACVSKLLQNLMKTKGEAHDALRILVMVQHPVLLPILCAGLGASNSEIRLTALEPEGDIDRALEAVTIIVAEEQQVWTSSNFPWQRFKQVICYESAPQKEMSAYLSHLTSTKKTELYLLLCDEPPSLDRFYSSWDRFLPSQLSRAFAVIVSNTFLEQWPQVAKILSSKQVKLMPRPTSTASLILDERSFVYLVSATKLGSRGSCEDIINKFASASLSFERAVIVVCHTDVASPEFYQIQKGLIAALTARFPIDVSIRHAFSDTEIALHIAKCIFEQANLNQAWEVKGENKYFQREWMQWSASPQEIFLAQFPSMNYFSACMVIHGESLSCRDFLSMTKSSMMRLCPWLPAKVVQHLQNILDLQIGTGWAFLRKVSSSNPPVVYPQGSPQFVYDESLYSSTPVLVDTEYVARDQQTIGKSGNQDPRIALLEASARTQSRKRSYSDWDGATDPSSRFQDPLHDPSHNGFTDPQLHRDMHLGPAQAGTPPDDLVSPPTLNRASNQRRGLAYQRDYEHRSEATSKSPRVSKMAKRVLFDSPVLSQEQPPQSNFSVLRDSEIPTRRTLTYQLPPGRSGQSKLAFVERVSASRN